MRKWLEAFAYRIPFTVEHFILASILTLIIALGVISGQVIRAATRNPVQALRYE